MRSSICAIDYNLDQLFTNRKSAEISLVSGFIIYQRV